MHKIIGAASMETGYKCLRKKRIRQRTNTRTSGKRRKGRELGSKNKSTIERVSVADVPRGHGGRVKKGNRENADESDETDDARFGRRQFLPV